MNLRALRLDRNVKQEELAQKIGVSASMISRYEKGSSVPPADKLAKIANVLHTSVDSLIGCGENAIDHVCIEDIIKTIKKWLNADTSDIPPEAVKLLKATYDICVKSVYDSVCAEDVTGTIGEWLDADMSDVPPEAAKLLKEAYDICANALG